jgi:hypothetical protein
MKTTLICLSAIALAAAGCHPFMDEPPDYTVMTERRPLGSTKELAVDLDYSVGTLEISKASSEDLFSFDLEYDRNRSTVDFDFTEGDKASLRVDFDANGWKGFGGGQGSRGRENTLTLRLSDRVPLDLDLSTGVTESHLDLTGMAVRRMRLRGGVGKTDVTFDKPVAEALTSLEVHSGVGELIIRGLGNARVGRLDLEGGVGRTELDYTGDFGSTQSESNIKVGVGQIHLIVPRDADVEIQAEGSFLSNINAPSFERNGRIYTHRGSENGSKIRIRVESGIGGVKVELI